MLSLSGFGVRSAHVPPVPIRWCDVMEQDSKVFEPPSWPDGNVTWIVQQADSAPRRFLSPDGEWGGAAAAEQFRTEEEAWLTVCPAGSAGVAVRMTKLPRRIGDPEPTID